MKKVPTLFARDPENMATVLPEIADGCGWVLAGEGEPTRKYDGTCCKFEQGQWWARREVKAGQDPPREYEVADRDTTTGKTVGWVPMASSSFAQWHADGASHLHELLIDGATYELCGPKVNGNPEHFDHHVLVRHFTAEKLVGCAAELPSEPQAAFEYLDGYLASANIEGIVWHHPDGRYAKIKARDFGHKRRVL